MRRRALALAAGVVAVLAGLPAAVTLARRDAGASPVVTVASRSAPASVVTSLPSTSTSTPTPTPSTTVAPLPVPEPPPSDPYADVAVEPVGTIEIPAIGLVHAVYEGVWLTVLDRGPGHWPGTARPGERGNTVFPGHRTTHTRPFYDLDRLRAGDDVIFDTADGRFTYSVTGTEIVSPKDLWVIDQTDAATMTLIACHPRGSARQRIVVRGELVRSERSPT